MGRSACRCWREQVYHDLDKAAACVLNRLTTLPDPPAMALPPRCTHLSRPLNRPIMQDNIRFIFVYFILIYIIGASVQKKGKDWVTMPSICTVTWNYRFCAEVPMPIPPKDDGLIPLPTTLKILLQKAKLPTLIDFNLDGFFLLSA